MGPKRAFLLRSLGMYGNVLRRSLTIFADKFKLLYS